MCPRLFIVVSLLYSAPSSYKPNDLNLGYGDSTLAWSPQTPDGHEFLEVMYAEAVYATSVHVYENLGPGSVTRVSSRRDRADATWDPLYEGEPNVRLYDASGELHEAM